jgi:hypothetical protein
MKDKTIREWFLWADTQGYEWAHKAMNNLILYPIKVDRASVRVNYLYEAIEAAFHWHTVPEGIRYWESISGQIYDNRI